MTINKLNYENYVIDYIEGTLSSEAKHDFDVFLQKHPEVNDEIKDYLSAPVYVEDKEVVFEDKDLLIKKTTVIPFGKLFLLLGVFLVGVYCFYSNFQSNNGIELLKETSTISKVESEKQIKVPVNSLQTNNEQDETEKIEVKEVKVKAPEKIKENKEQEEVKLEVEKTKSENQDSRNLYAESQTNDSKIKDEDNMHIDTEVVELEKQSEVANVDTQIHKTIEDASKELVESKHIASVNEIAIITKEKLRPVRKPVRTMVMRIANVTPATYQSNEPKSKIIDMFIPKAYKEADLKNSLAISNTAKEQKNLLKAFTPKSIGK